MQKAILTLFFLFSYSFASAQMIEKPISSKIDKVRVFLNEAEINHTVKTNVTAGTYTLVFEDLSAKLHQQSIQVNATGTLTIMGVKHRINYLKSQTKTEKIKKLKEEFEAFEDQLYLLASQKKNFQEEEGMILKNNQISVQAGFTAQKLKEMADFYRQRLGEISQKILEINKQEKNIQEKTNTLAKQIQEESSSVDKPMSEILVTIKVDVPTAASFDVSYIVPGAGWEAVYDIRTKDTKTPSQIVYRANVYQNTGLDWNNVMLSLSSGNPSLGGEKPELSVWYVSQFTQVSSYGYINSRSAKNKVSAEVANAVVTADEFKKTDSDKPESLSEYTKVQENTLATEFEIALPYTIPTDGKQQLVEVQKFEVNSIYSYSAVPKLDKSAFLTARLVGWEKFNLVSGKANVYFEGAFVGETQLNTQNTKDTLVVSLGRDKRVVIEREQIKNFTTKKRFGSSIKEEFGYSITIRNTKKEKIILRLEDQIPISNSNKIEVELLEADGAKADPIAGRVSWKMEINPAETKKLILRYSIRYPKDMQITY